MDQTRLDQLLMLRNIRGKEIRKDGCSTIDLTNFATQDVAAMKIILSLLIWLMPRMLSWQANDIVATREVLTPGSLHKTVGHTPKHTRQRIAYFSERYKNITPVEREFRRECLRLYNRTPRRKEAKVDDNRKRRVMKADNLNQASIAREDPTYTPEFVHPIADATEPDGSTVYDLVIPEFVKTPLFPISTQTEDFTSPDMSIIPLKRKHHVPCGERQAILAHRNQQFEAAIARKVATSIEDTSGDACEGDDWTRCHTTMKITNNGDDGVIFEDDDDENEGYLFVGQYEDTDEDIEIDGTQDESTATDVLDSYDKVYNNILEETHMLKTVPNCEANLDGMQISQRLEYPWTKWMHTLRHIGQVMQMMKMRIRPGVFNPILHGKRLFQQFAVDTYIKIESSRLDFICKNQDRLRANLYQGLVDSMLDGDIRAEKVGKRTVLWTSFIGGHRDMRRRYMDAMTLRKYKLTCPEQYDLLISAEIPSNKYPELRKMVIKHMMHGSCGSLTLTAHAPRVVNHARIITLGLSVTQPCKGRIRTLFTDVMTMIVKKRSEGANWTIDGVVPYNPYLLRLFNCHINVEACGSIKAIKYLFKYIYKGHDRVSVVMRNASKADEDVDEIKQYRDAWWVTPPEALWRIYGFDLGQIPPPVMQLQLHLPNMHMVAFHERQMAERVLNRPGVDKSMLTSYFEANRLHEEARGIIYHDFPEWYTWQSAYNREAASKSRLRKKAYIQQLESCRLKLSQMEQDMQRARSQGIFLGVSTMQFLRQSPIFI
ncbi:Helicase [Zea mays]|uniref:Helicase n=1 Tax=Zea mays TaxID=4577 RepID=A0A1D6EI53_MAIZE|nr:Helicase [Zea mays]